MLLGLRLSFEAYRSLSDVTDVDGATVLRVPEAPDSPMLNRVVGLGVERPATEAGLDRALAVLGGGVTFYGSRAPSARPAELAEWLRARGLRPGWGWVTFSRTVADPPSAQTSLRVAQVEDGDAAAALGHIVRVGFDLPPAIEPAIARAPDAGWSCWLALDGDEPVAAAGLYVASGAGYLGLAATLPGQRGKGAQSALLAARVRAAAAHGCSLVFTETGERRSERPSNSYRNILRAGFTELGVTANWIGQA
jgi:GNAT superfamily N-acetyltransferase